MIDICQYRTSIGSFYLKTFKYKFKYKSKSNPQNSNFKINLILIFLIFGAQINDNFDKITSTQNNKLSHIIHGNISKNGSYKIVSWNKGNSLFQNKLDDIKFIIGNISPDILALHEANYNINVPVKIPGYRYEYNLLAPNNSISRSLLIINENISNNCKD